MLRRRFASPSSCLITSSAKASIFPTTASLFSSISSSSSSSSSTGDGITLQELIDPRIQKISSFLQKEKQPELVILVDATALLYRMCFSFRSKMAQHGCLEADPAHHFHSSLPKFLRFLHSVVPTVEKSYTNLIDESPGACHNFLLPPDVAAEALMSKFLEPSGGPWQTAGEAHHLAQWKKKRTSVMNSGEDGGESDILSMSQEEEKKKKKDAQRKSYRVASTPQSAAAVAAGSSNSYGFGSTEGEAPLLVESADSPGFVKRKVIFCYDHGGSEDPLRMKYCPEYKAQRPRCGRVSSFVGYGTAIARQLHSFGLIQGTLPTQLPFVEHDSKMTPPQGSFQRFLEDLERNNNKQHHHHSLQKQSNSNNNNIRSSTNEEVINNIIYGATSGNPSRLQDLVPAEADDLLFTAAKYYAVEQNTPTMIVTHDKDLLQLLELPNLFFYHLGQNRFITRQETCKHYQISSPKFLADYLALLGDAADNVKGLEGVGGRRAVSIMEKFGSLDNLVKAAEQQEIDAKNPKKSSAAGVDVGGKEGKKKKKKDSSSSIVLSTLQEEERKALLREADRDEKPVAGDGEEEDEDQNGGDGDDDGKSSSSSSDREQKRLKNFFDNKLFPLVRKNAKQLFNIRDNVIKLHDIPQAREDLKEMEKQAGKVENLALAKVKNSSNNKDKNSSNKLKHHFSSKFMNDKFVFTQLPSHIWTSAVFRRRDGRDGPLAFDGTSSDTEKVAAHLVTNSNNHNNKKKKSGGTSSSSSTTTTTKGVFVGKDGEKFKRPMTAQRRIWSEIRQSFIKSHGACSKSDELVHRCGNYFPGKEKDERTFKERWRQAVVAAAEATKKESEKEGAEKLLSKKKKIKKEKGKKITGKGKSGGKKQQQQQKAAKGKQQQQQKKGKQGKNKTKNNNKKKLKFSVSGKKTNKISKSKSKKKKQR